MTTTVTLTINDTAKKVLIGLGVLGFTATTAVGGYFGINAVVGNNAPVAPVEVVSETYAPMTITEINNSASPSVRVRVNGIDQDLRLVGTNGKFAVRFHGDEKYTTFVLNGQYHGVATIYRNGSKDGVTANFWYGDNGQIVIEGTNTFVFPQWVRS